MQDFTEFLGIAYDLEANGLSWVPEIGDEVSSRLQPEAVSVLVNTTAVDTEQIRDTYLWLPTVEQLLSQLEKRGAILFHAGMEIENGEVEYRTVVHFNSKAFEAKGKSLRSVLASVLKNLLLNDSQEIH